MRHPLALLLALTASTPAAAQTPAPPWATRLLAAYPGLVSQVTASEVILSNGTRLPRTLGPAAATEAERQAHPDIDAMFVDPYPAGAPLSPAPATDPGRTRYEPFFDAIYGDCRKGNVRLRDVAWLPGRGGGSIRVTTTNHVAEQLEAVIRDLEKLPPAMTRYLFPHSGGYSCRAIAGTSQRSMHSYGIAVDLASGQADYWRWSGGEGARYRNRLPAAIVAAFERHGFIWGGRWRHFDTMHFEYRPELLPVR
ncbi:MAG: hypothetical protein B7Y43_11105 [Sphingomonas sp. 28-62-20]|uniref:M15 family metallopeptidase n=1 Tax=Sphingomonas sp. 28-62-20 TaxID=1970433 RepID=UPI000BCD26C9|nr:MAG: hypothetical protein B7Y43_11105 [Sphingomonas sp. 28-62-20]